MAARVTIQDIADELGLSRNTVSKAINNTGILADTTREKIIQKAIEMGYKQFSYVTLIPQGKTADGPASALSLVPASSTAEQSHRKKTYESPCAIPDPRSAQAASGRRKGVIALFSTMFLGASHFSSTMLDKVQYELSTLGYSLAMHRVNPENLKNMTLPNSFHIESVDAILCFEMFQPEYSDMVCALGLPVLFVDSPASMCNSTLKVDRLLMDNRSNIYAFVNEMAKRGKTRIGFIGDHLHCMSFFERYMALREALVMLNLPYRDEYSILGTSSTDATDQSQSSDAVYESYRRHLLNHLSRMKELPDVFICANDFVAVDVLQSLRKLNISVPDDVYLCGFDDSPESRIITPPLTTIHIHSQIMGYSAVHLLMSRIENPDMNFRTIYTETSLIYRESTGDF